MATNVPVQHEAGVSHHTYQLRGQEPKLSKLWLPPQPEKQFAVIGLINLFSNQASLGSKGQCVDTIADKRCIKLHNRNISCCADGAIIA